MRWVRSLISVLLILVMLGSVISPAMAKSAMAAVVPDTKINTIIYKSERLSIVEIKGKIVYNKALNAFKESAKLIKYLGDYKPEYDKAKVYIIKYNGTPTEVIRIPLKGDKPAVFTYTKDQYKTVMLVKVVDTSSQEIKYYVYNNGKIKTKVYTVLDHNGDIFPLWVSTPGSGGGTHEKISYQSAKALGLPEEYRIILRDHSGDPDKYDQGWNRIWKHGYCPVGPWGFGVHLMRVMKTLLML